MVHEDIRTGDGSTQVSATDERDIMLSRRVQNIPDVVDKVVDIIANTTLAELPKGGKVAPYLGGIDIRIFAENPGGDCFTTGLPGLGEDLEIARKPGGHSESQSFFRHSLTSIVSVRYKHYFIQYCKVMQPTFAWGFPLLQL